MLMGNHVKHVARDRDRTAFNIIVTMLAQGARIEQRTKKTYIILNVSGVCEWHGSHATHQMRCR